MTLRNAYSVSALGHVAALSALMAVSSLLRPTLFVGGVSIVMPPPGSGPGGGQAAAPRRQTEPEREPEPERQPPPPEERERRHPQPEQNVVKQPDRDGLLPLPKDDVPSERPDERDPLPEPEPPPPPPADTTTPDGPDDGLGAGKRGTGGDGTTGTGSGIGIEGGVLGAHAPWYLMQLHDKIAANWRPPPVIGRSGEAAAKFHFVLQSNGTIAAVQSLESSGVRTYDMSGMRAIYNSSPLPPIPEDIGESTLGITLTFSKTY